MSFNSNKIQDILFDKRQVVCVQGLGFVGAAMSTAVASSKSKNGSVLYTVIGIELPNPEGERIVSSINNGVFPFENSDVDLAEALNDAVIKNKNLHACTNAEYFQYADVVIVDINLDVYYDNNASPFLKLDNFKNAIHSFGSRIKEDTLVLIETTVPPGTCEKVVLPILTEEFTKRGIKKKPLIAHSYERVMPGKNYLSSIKNFWRVYSGIDKESADKCQTFLESVISTEEYPLTRLKSTNASEIGKVLENSYRATNIAFMEEWGRFAETIGVDLFEVIDAIKMRPTHSNMMYPGFGVGGYCLTKDPWFAKLAASGLFGIENMDFPFCSLAVHYNKKMPIVSLDYIEKILGNLKGKRLLMLGVSYRQDVGDTRYSPSEIFAREAIKRGAIMSYEDPLVKYWKEMDTTVSNTLPPLDEDDNKYDAVIFTVKHKQYQDINFNSLNIGKKTLIFDANRVLSKEQIQDIKSRNLNFYSIGRGE